MHGATPRECQFLPPHCIIMQENTENILTPSECMGLLSENMCSFYHHTVLSCKKAQSSEVTPKAAIRRQITATLTRLRQIVLLFYYAMSNVPIPECRGLMFVMDCGPLKENWHIRRDAAGCHSRRVFLQRPWEPSLGFTTHQATYKERPGTAGTSLSGRSTGSTSQSPAHHEAAGKERRAQNDPNVSE